jgi:hypothetical protein
MEGRKRVKIYIALFVLVFVGVVGFNIANVTHVEHKTCSVTDKDRSVKINSDSHGNTTSSSDARVYTKDCGTLRVADSWLSWTFSSADTYASIHKGRRYDIATRGFRIPFLSMFPNVVEAKEVE